MIYLVVHNNICVNRITYDGGAWTPPEGMTIEMEGEQSVDIGWHKIDGEWSPAPEEPELPE